MDSYLRILALSFNQSSLLFSPPLKHSNFEFHFLAMNFLGAVAALRDKCQPTLDSCCFSSPFICGRGLSAQNKDGTIKAGTHVTGFIYLFYFF